MKLLKTNVISVQLILPRSRRYAAAPRKYQPREVNGSIDKYCADRSQSGRSIQFQSPSSVVVRARMESKQEKMAKGLAEYFQQFARQRTMSSCHTMSCAFLLVPECFNTMGSGGGWFRKQRTAWGEKRLWKLKVLPTCTASEDTSV